MSLFSKTSKTSSVSPSSLIHQHLAPRERERRAQLRSGQPGPFAVDASRTFGHDKDRYGDIRPYDRTRVRLPASAEDKLDAAEDWYLNASEIREVDGGRTWIAAQAPLPQTLGTFYAYILCSSISLVVQLTDYVERGMRKADPYLPTAASPSLALPGQMTVRWLATQDRTSDLGCSITDVEIQHGETRKRIKHVFYGRWPDKGVPTGKAGTDELLRLIDLTNSLNPPSGPPVLVHCSAGVGRTGSFIAIASLLRLLPLHPSPASIPRPPPSSLGPLHPDVRDLPQAVVIDWIREQRCMSVETAEQVDLVWRATQPAGREGAGPADVVEAQ